MAGISTERMDEIPATALEAAKTHERERILDALRLSGGIIGGPGALPQAWVAAYHGAIRHEEAEYCRRAAGRRRCQLDLDWHTDDECRRDGE